MSALPVGFAAMYASGLTSHLRQSRESALHQAYELGRQALSQGVGVLDLCMLHHDALESFMLDHTVDDEGDWLELASEFLAECLSPFEMTLRGYRDANNRLIAANGELSRMHAAVALANERLTAEMEERKRAEEALLHANKLQAVGLLAGGVAHHFNNLLTVVMGNLELARLRLAGDEKAERLLVNARRGAERGAEVTRHLLSFSRQQMLQPRALDLSAWLGGMRSLLAGSLRGDILVETEIADPPPEIRIDPGQLELAVLNLAVNAQDAMPGGGTLKLRLGRRRVRDGRLGLAGDFAVVEVVDTGHGVPPELLSRVFEPFFTTKDGGPGAGLGLSQVHGFTHQSGGAVEMESRPGEGTLVRLYLPALGAAEAAAAAEPPPVAPAPPGSGRVLVVEDDEAVAEMARELLQSLGYSVTLAHRAQAALDLIERGEPVDLVFSDTVMPGGMTGVQLAEAVHRVQPSLPVLLTSGYSEAIERHGADGAAFIGKPYRPEDLGRRIAELLGRA